MSISTFNFASMAAQITEEQGISFQDKAKTWDSASDVQEVVDALNNQSSVHFLNLDGNTLGVEAAKAIGEALKRHPEFRKALWKNLFTRRLKSEIPEALQHLGAGLIEAKAKLTVLDLSDNALGPNGMRGLEVFLRSPVCYSLQELHLYNCGLGPEGGAMLSKALIDLHGNARKAGTPLQLRLFVGGRNRLEDAGAKALAKAFATLKTLQEIVLLQNSIYLEGVKALADSFKANPHLRVLNMYDNTLKSRGADEIAEVIKGLTMLREIHFGDCLIGTNGAYQIAEALENSNNDIEVIDLSSNEINSDGGLVLVSAIQNKPKLRVLNIDGNCFGQEGCAQIIEQMSTYPNAAALQPFEEDEDENDSQESSEEEEEEEEQGDEYDDGNDEYDEHEHANDTTEEADEDEEEYAEETAYLTTNAYTTKLFNESTNSKASDTFAIGNKPPITFCNPEQFCLSQTPCSLQQFESLDEENKLQALQGIINQFTDDNHLLLLVFTTLKCAHLSQLSQPALELAVSLFQATFDYAVKTKQETRVLNYVLKQLGLLRSEETFKTDYDVKSCRHALREALQKPEFANDSIKKSFKLYLDNVDA
ncbi:ran GTPase-activating protein [Drosophila subobscura]|uniref:ran GTPase-activating protein n=1 Tax=Drosophila subobscura TaxID=7241 RepID=UPI00155AA7F7|nr:ran GTPase-activating protein [Drosophila subobscura]